MLDHTRTVIDFLNILDSDIAEYGKSSPLLSALNRESNLRQVETLSGERKFSWNATPRNPGPKTIKIQYSREEPKIQTLKIALGVGSAKAVGEATFDLIFNEQNKNNE